MELAEKCVADMGHSRLLLWLGVVRCAHSAMDLQPAGMISRRATILSPPSHTHRRLPQVHASSSRGIEAACADGGPKFTGGKHSVLQICGESFHVVCRRVGGLDLHARERRETEELQHH